MKVKLHEPTFGEEEIEAAVAVMRSTNVTMGEKVREFEEAFAFKKSCQSISFYCKSWKADDPSGFLEAF